MTISERFRQLALDAGQLCRRFERQADGVRIDRAVALLHKGEQQLSDWSERVGEIPRVSLEYKLSPVLLQVHSTFDRARVLYEQHEDPAAGEKIWVMEQAVYRLLNDL